MQSEKKAAPATEGDYEEEPAKKKSDVDQVIAEYQEEAKRREATAKATYYKYDSDQPRAERVFIAYFTGEEIPQRHELGLMFGGGKYAVKLELPQGTAEERDGTTYVFKIHPVYNEHKARHDAEKRKKELAELQAANPTAAAGGGSAEQTFLMVERILALILPTIKAANTQAALSAPAKNDGRDLLQQYGLMQEILKNNLYDTAETYREFNQRFKDLSTDSIEDAETDETAEPPAKEAGIVETIVKLIEPFFGLIAQNSPAAKIAATTLKAAPQFAEVLSDPNLCRMIVSYFDKTKGVEKANLALKNIGINRAQLFAGPARSPAATGSPAARQVPPRAAPAAGQVRTPQAPAQRSKKAA
jgi:hypothetical protein